MDAVVARLEAELDGAPVGLLELHHELVVGVADEAASLEVLREHQPGRGLTHVGHDHVAGAGELDVVGGVLGPAAGVGSASEGLVEGELVRLVQGDLAVAGRRPPRPACPSQVVGEEAAAEILRLLGHLVGGAGGEEGVAPHVGGLVDEERRAVLPALQAGDRPRGTGVENRDADVGGDRVHLVPQGAVGVAIVPEEQALLVRVARVVEEELGPAGRVGGRPAIAPCPRAHECQCLLELAHGGLVEEDGVLRVDPPELAEHSGESSRVRDRVPQGGTVSPPLVGPGDQREALNDLGPRGVRGARDGERQGAGGEKLQRRHGTDSLEREKTDCSRPRGRGRGGGAPRIRQWRR